VVRSYLQQREREKEKRPEHDPWEKEKKPCCIIRGERKRDRKTSTHSENNWNNSTLIRGKKRERARKPHRKGKKKGERRYGSEEGTDDVLCRGGKT